MSVGQDWPQREIQFVQHKISERATIVALVTVPTEIRLVDIRGEIVQQLSANTDELVPREYVFLRSVGRSLTTLRLKQEYQLKAKHFIPPVAYAPELFILEATPEVREALAISDASSQSPPLSRQISPRGYPNSSRTGPGGVPETERLSRPFQRVTSPGNKYKPLPHIGSDPYRGRDKNRVINRDPYNHTSSSPSPHTNHHNSNNYPYDPYIPYHYNGKDKTNKHSPKKNNQPPQEIDSEQPGSEWDEQPENKHSTRDQTPSPVKRSPPQSAEKGRNRRHDDDSGIAGLSPDDDHHKRNKDEYDNILRRTKDLQKHLDSERFTLDGETEEERKRRLEDLESRNFMDRQRWNDDQEERRQRAMEDRLKEEERKREKEDKKRRKKEDEEKKRQDEEEKRKKEEEEKKKRDEEEKRKKEEEEEKRRRDEEEKRNKEEEVKRKKEDEEKKKREEDRKKIDKEESEKKKRDEKHKADEEKRRRKEEEDERRQREGQERQKEEEKLRKLREDGPEIAFPRTQHISSPEEVIRDTESAWQRRKDEKNQLLKDIEGARQARQDQEKVREELVRKAKQMQHKTTNRRNEARDMWKKKYFEEKKKTAPLEENSNRLRNELETLHKRLVSTLEGPKEKHLRLTESRPSEKNNYVVQSTKLQHEIEDLQRRVENARMKLTAEMKLRNQAQGELRALRAELTQRKQSIQLNRQQQLASLSSYMKNDKENSSPSENMMVSDR